MAADADHAETFNDKVAVLINAVNDVYSDPTHQSKKVRAIRGHKDYSETAFGEMVSWFQETDIYARN
ncbi:MAG: hypothetical protein EHM35_07410 [Planctomycetaceae bacterium]|nr:MAG: hypothetical protein EHM35_07410 [Planctomycetaceae bacterium]